LTARCAPQVDAASSRAVVAVESGFNPHAIGVVGGVLHHQPRSRAQAEATARQLLSNGWNFSLGLAQINVRNLDRLGLTPAQALERCTNLAAMQTLLLECFERAQRSSRPAQRALRQALSCYYSGDFVTGVRHGYVARVAAAAAAAAAPAVPPVNPTPEPLP
jgi:type IV secretion system protein VirB1